MPGRRPFLERTRATAMSDDLSFRVVRSNDSDETLARCTNLPIAQAAYSAAARMYPEDLIELRQGARIVEKASNHGPPNAHNAKARTAHSAHARRTDVRGPTRGFEPSQQALAHLCCASGGPEQASGFGRSAHRTTFRPPTRGISGRGLGVS
jgi:hypothetical protein